MDNHGQGSSGRVQDRETQQDFVPFYLGASASPSGASPLCLSQNVTVNHRNQVLPDALEEPAPGDQDPEIDPALPGGRHETLVQASYVAVADLGQCGGLSPVTGAAEWNLDVISMAENSTSARAWRTAFKQDAEASEVATDDPDAFRAGLQPFTFGAGTGTAYVVPAGDGVGASALLEVGNVTLMITGDFSESGLQSIVDNLRSQP